MNVQSKLRQKTKILYLTLTLKNQLLLTSLLADNFFTCKDEVGWQEVKWVVA